MKKIVKAAVIAATLVLTTSTYAQNAPRRDGCKAECRTECREYRKDKPTVEQRAEAVTKRMTEALSLSEQQAKSVYALTLQKLSDEQAIRERYREGMVKILNADQQAELKKRMAERRDRRNAHGHGGGQRK